MEHPELKDKDIWELGYCSTSDSDDNDDVDEDDEGEESEEEEANESEDSSGCEESKDEPSGEN